MRCRTLAAPDALLRFVPSWGTLSLKSAPARRPPPPGGGEPLLKAASCHSPFYHFQTTHGRLDWNLEGWRRGQINMIGQLDTSIQNTRSKKKCASTHTLVACSPYFCFITCTHPYSSHQASNYLQHFRDTYGPGGAARRGLGVARDGKVGALVSFQSFNLHIKVITDPNT